MEGREIALVVAVRRATDGSGWLALTPPHRETFKWQSACRAMVPCHNYRPKARERELSNAASMLNLGNTNKWRKACRRRNQNGSTRQTRKQPKYHWSPISLPQRPCKWLSIPLNLKYKIPDEGPSINDVMLIFRVFGPPLCHAFTQPISTVCHDSGNPPSPPRA